MANEKMAAYLEGTREQRARNLWTYAGKSIEERIAHLEILDSVRIETGYELRVEQAPFGTTREQAVAIAQSKLKHNKRRAGVQALKRKYGKEGAEQILLEKTGRRISIK